MISLAACSRVFSSSLFSNSANSTAALDIDRPRMLTASPTASDFSSSTCFRNAGTFSRLRAVRSDTPAFLAAWVICSPAARCPAKTASA